MPLTASVRAFSLSTAERLVSAASILEFLGVTGWWSELTEVMSRGRRLTQAGLPLSPDNHSEAETTGLQRTRVGGNRSS